MVAVPAEHDVAFLKPWYAAGRDVALHRYFDADFVDRFNNDVLDASPDLLRWEQEDRDSTGTVLKLRRPVHRTFHLVAAEIACRLPGSPALGPAAQARRPSGRGGGPRAAARRSAAVARHRRERQVRPAGGRARRHLH